MGLLFVLSLIPAVMCGECEVDWNSLQVQGNFQFDRYMGVWYEISYLDPEEPPFSPWIMDNVQYIYNQSSALMGHAAMVGTMRKPADSPCIHRDGRGYMKLVADPQNPAKMVYKISRSGKFPDSYYFVLSTDYENYALVVACQVTKLSNGICQGGTKFNVLSRAKTLSHESLRRIQQQLLIQTLCVKYEDFMTIRFNTDC